MTHPLPPGVPTGLRSNPVETRRGSSKAAGVDVEFLLGPAGTGKTHRCLADLRAELRARPEGPPLIFLAPKQATFQIERQLLGDGTVAGFTRLHILSFPRLAHFLHEKLGEPEPRLVDETGRVMVLRALLRSHRDALVVFRRSASQPGFAGELSRQMREFQEQGVTPTDLEQGAEQPGITPTLAGKLRDTAHLARAYATWLQAHGLTDPDFLLDTASALLRTARRTGRPPEIGGIWLDGFAEMTPQELHLLTEVVATAGRATLAFCLEDRPDESVEPLSPWSVISDTFRRAHAQLAQQPGGRIQVNRLRRDPRQSRFSAAPFLAHVEENWRRPKLPVTTPEVGPTAPEAIPSTPARATGSGQLDFNWALQSTPETIPQLNSMDTSSLQLQAADSVEAEALLAARAIEQHVARGGRYRECAVLLRSLDTHGDVIRRTWRRLGLPMFLDRREPVGGEPLTTLTRCALRLGAGDWSHEDWFGALRSGLAGLELDAVDRLENAALASGWSGGYWSGVTRTSDLPREHQNLVAPFRQFSSAVAGTPNGALMVLALTTLWKQLNVQSTLEQWDGSPAGAGLGRHQAVHRQLEGWVDEIQRSLGTTVMAPGEWLEVFESAWSGLTVGLVPPALDQVLVGAIDRSRNPNLALVVLPGWNEGQFPQGTASVGLLTSAERHWLRSGTGTSTVRIPEVVTAARESFLAYIALTRASQQVLVTWTEAPPPAAPRSPYLTRLERLGVPRPALLPPLRAVDLWRAYPVGTLPPAEPTPGTEQLSPGLAEAFYGHSLTLSASRLERVATCPHQSFLLDALRVREREVLQFEAMEQGDLVHQVLAEYHRQVLLEGASWADPNTEAVAGRLQTAIARVEQRTHIGTHPRRQYAEQCLRGQLLKYVLDAAGWMAGYPFRPESAELGFGRRSPGGLPPLRFELPPNRSITLEGQLDRVDRGIPPSAAVLVIDYKSRERKWDQVAVDAGLDLQLPIYALALQAAGETVGGAAYASLKPRTTTAKSRGEAAPAVGPSYVHRGIFSADQVPTESTTTDKLPFRWEVNRDGQPTKRSDRKPADVFAHLIQGAATRIGALAGDLFAGTVRAEPSPVAKVWPCDRCAVRAACRRI